MRSRSFRLKTHLHRLTFGALVVATALLLNQSRERTELEAVQSNGVLKLVTRPGPITYYEDAKGENGFEYLLARNFANYLGVKLRVTTTTSLGQVFNMLGGPNGDVAGATLTITPERLQRYRFSIPYAQVVQRVLYRRGSRPPSEVIDLIGKELAVIADSSHEERLEELREDYPDLQWLSVDSVEMIELMEMVDSGEVDYAVIDSTTYDAHRTMYPNALSAFSISAPQDLAWAFAASGDDSLVKAANRFLTREMESGRLNALISKFFSDVEHFSVAGSILFMKRMTTRLPGFRDQFIEVADQLGTDWHLLAAIAYQESHWNPVAVSPTGVKGMMMLTKRAAQEVGVTNRLESTQSIEGGARYFRQTKARIPVDITEPDRTLFALAAYNVGLGHLDDARVLAERAGKNSHTWDQVKEFLPLLQRRKYYSTVRHGYARGQEPVNYVRNVLKYRQLLQWNTIEENRRNQREQRNAPPDLQSWDRDSFRTL